MRYLSSISLALAVLMALACTAEPKPTATPQGTPLPKFQPGDARDLIIAHLKTIPGEFWAEGVQTTNSGDYLVVLAARLGERHGVKFVAKQDYLGDGIWRVYIDNEANSGDTLQVPIGLLFRWKVNERTHLVTGDPYPVVAEATRDNYKTGQFPLAICFR